MVIKLYENGNTSLVPRVYGISDLAICPQDPRNMAVSFSEAVYISRNGGRSWENLGMPPYRSNGIKAVAISFLPGPTGSHELTVFCSHSIYGIYYINPLRSGAEWTELSGGIERLETTDHPDEI